MLDLHSNAVACEIIFDEKKEYCFFVESLITQKFFEKNFKKINLLWYDDICKLWHENDSSLGYKADTDLLKCNTNWLKI